MSFGPLLRYSIIGFGFSFMTILIYYHLESVQDKLISKTLYVKAAAMNTGTGTAEMKSPTDAEMADGRTPLNPAAQSDYQSKEGGFAQPVVRRTDYSPSARGVDAGGTGGSGDTREVHRQR